MGREEQIVNERLRKIKELRDSGINPYAHKFEKKDITFDLQEKHKDLKVGEKSKSTAKTAGRLMIKRDLGKIAFGVLQDQYGKIQIVVQDPDTPDKVIQLFKKYADSGDFIGVEGPIFRTQRGELSIMLKDLQILTKSVYPLPEKFHGLQNEEDIYRKRYLDLTMNQETRDIFAKKSKFWRTVREFLQDKGFTEVETPVLEVSAGGAAATPFKTHHNALDLDVYLRISMGELWQKKLLVAGYDKTFEIGRQFRNEGMDMEHLQDYTQMEFYWAYADYNDGMALVKEMYKKVAKEVLGTLKFTTHGYDVDLSKEWELYDYESLIKKKTGIDIYKASVKDIQKKLDELKMEYEENVDKWRLIDILWKYCRKSLSGPGFLVNQPVEITPLAKRNPKDPRKVEQFQVIIGGTEMGNGYSELNDPIDQENRFIEQRQKKEAGDTEAHEHDEGFVEALKQGMPPACGFGVSERFFSYLVDRPVRDCVFFPLMKPLVEETKATKEKDKKKVKK